MIEMYDENIQKNIGKICEAKSPGKDESVISVSSQGITLKLHVNIQTHNIIHAYYEGNTNELMRGILNLFCSSIIDLPIIEASHHGTLKLEYALRKVGSSPVGGIITPNNTLEQFIVVQKLIRDAFKQYQANVLNAPCKNAYIPVSAKVWAQLSDDVKTKKLTQLLDQYFADIHESEYDYALSVIGPMRIEFVLYNQKMENAGCFLLNLEKYIQRYTQAPVEVMYTERTDKNRVRQKSRK